ncbi:MAG TPA: fibronectin type III domain-containing protein [Myxococcaceae bacterium]|nr:fibronectin type III domain-containing protein [Myxococcaceae bacterium]
MPLRGWALVALGSLLLSTVVACDSDSTPTGGPFGGRPPSPGTLSLEVQGYNSFQLQWQAPPGPVDGFFVEGHVDTEIVPFQQWPGGRAPAGQLETTIVLDTTMPELVPLAFRVRSFIGNQVSEPTNAVVFETPVWPPADAAALSGDGGVEVSWNAGSRLADRILIDRLSSPDAGTADRTWTLPPSGGELLDGEVIEGTRYWYRLRSGFGDVTSPAIELDVLVE